LKELKFILYYNSVTTELIHTPVGWNEFSVNCSRDLQDFFGMARTYNAKVQFVKEGADIVRTAIYTDGLKADVTLTIQKRNIYTNIFETKFTGKLIFTDFKDTEDSIECGIIEGGIFADVKNKMDTKWNVPSSAVTLLKYNGIASAFETVKLLQGWQSSVGYSADEINDKNVSVYWTYSQVPNYPILFPENDFADYQGGYMKFNKAEVDYTDPQNPTLKIGSEFPMQCLKNCHLKINIQPTDMRIEQGTGDGGWVTMKYTFRFMKRVGGIDTIISEWGDTYISSPETQTETLVVVSMDNTEKEIIINAVAGDTYWMMVHREFVSSDEQGFVFYEAAVSTVPLWDAALNMNVVITAPLPEENFKCITAIDLFTNLGLQIGNYPVKSDFLSNYSNTQHGTVAVGNELVFFNGWAVGKIPTREDFIMTSLRDFIKFLRVSENCGFGIENIAGVDTLVIEPLNYWLDNSNIMNLPDIAEVNTSMATDLIHSEISVGYPRYEYNDNFGLDEFNGTINFKTPVKDVTSTLDLISPIRADGAGIDYIRKLRLDKIYKTKIEQNNRDVNFDNDLFCVYAKYDSHVAPINYYKTINNSVDMVPTPTGTVYPLNQVNYYLSPKRCLKRNGAFIKSFLWGYSSEVLQYLTTENNPDVVSQFTAETAAVTETANEVISGLNAALFHPVYITISIPGKYSIVDFLSVYASGLFTFTYNGALFKGILVEADINMAYDQTSTIKILSHISNDLKKLI